MHFFLILLLGGPSPPSKLVPNPFNWSPNIVFTDISVSVAQIQKIQKTRCIFFRILLLGGPSPPSQLVPNPFNWSQNTVFYRYLGIGPTNKKNKKKGAFFSNSASGRTLPIQSTGAQPIQLVPWYVFCWIFELFLLVSHLFIINSRVELCVNLTFFLN